MPKKKEVQEKKPDYDNPEANLKLKEEPQPLKVAFKPGKTVEKYGLSEEEIKDVVAFYLGCPPDFVIWGGCDCKVDLEMLARAGYNFEGFKPCKFKAV